ncbi:response regulator [Starkeya koreensis]|uniref:Response regulator n=1 Tax=Ancylobacter koreensis TaxID=266121 RepID=A0ABT0DKS8_9HYPH|nr:response regulator [Ancylobacter koreensis]MCK0207888.1 response regulator [Ancylobacter koreensis]
MSQLRSMLICDDEEELAHELGEYFSFAGWSVEVCVTAQDAIDRLCNRPGPLVLLTDLRIGPFDGRQVVAAARARPEGERPRMIVIVTGHVMDNVSAADFDSDHLCVKPVDPDELGAVIDAFLETHAPPSE